MVAGAHASVAQRTGEAPRPVLQFAVSNDGPVVEDDGRPLRIGGGKRSRLEAVVRHRMHSAVPTRSRGSCFYERDSAMSRLAAGGLKDVSGRVEESGRPRAAVP